MSTVIGNAANRPLNAQAGGFPDVSQALLDWFQPMTFGVLTTVQKGFKALQTQVQISFQGVWQPFTDKKLMLLPEGERARSWFTLHADPSLTLAVDAVVTYLGTQYRVMSQKDYRLNGYVEYTLVEDWTGSGPTPVTP